MGILDRGESNPPFPSARQAAPECATLAEIGKRSERKCLVEVMCVARLETIVARCRRLRIKRACGTPPRAQSGPNLSLMQIGIKYKIKLREIFFIFGSVRNQNATDLQAPPTVFWYCQSYCAGGCWISIGASE